VLLYRLKVTMFGGTCEMTRSDIIACVPEGGPPHGNGEPDGPPPVEGSYN
jgi:hypothetical protein